MLPFHIFGFSLSPKTTIKYLYTQQSIDDITLHYAEEESFDSLAFSEDDNDDEEESSFPDLIDLAILDQATQNAWYFEEPNAEDLEEDDDDFLL